MGRRKKKGPEFSFGDLGFYRKLMPKTAVKELRRLNKVHKRLTAEIVLDSARSAQSPLHDMFEWDDAVAAEKYRLHQARNMILSLRSVETEDDGSQYVARVYVGARDEDGYHYVEVKDVDPDTADQIMANAIRDLKAWMDRYDELRARLPGVFAAIALAIKASRPKAA